MHEILLAATLLRVATSISHNRILQGADPSSNVDCDAVESQYTIQVIDMSEDPSSTDPRYTEAFQLAANRWSKVIVGDVPNFPANQVDDWFGGRFAPRFFNGPVDDLVIGFEIPTTIDGPSGTLGSAGAVFVRRDRFGNPLSTASGVMTFDGIDLDLMDIEDVKAVILHEMGHVIGLVGTTGRCTRACDPNNARRQSPYECDLANAEYARLAPGTLLLENDGGAGTACGHWEENSFREGASSELMTGFFEANLFQPISKVTVAAFEDLGYEVDFCGADIWPATEDTIQKWTVFKTAGSMGTDGADQIPPEWVIDEETGETSSWGGRSASSSLRLLPAIAISVVASVAALLL